MKASWINVIVTQIIMGIQKITKLKFEISWIDDETMLEGIITSALGSGQSQDTVVHKI